MVRRVLMGVGLLVAGLTTSAYLMYLANETPIVVPVPSTEAAQPTRPYVIKLHAQWCPVCMMTKPMWTEIERAYSSRVNLVVFDFTSRETTDASRHEARRLGLESVFVDHEGWTGTVLVLDGRQKDVTATIHGGRDFAEYQAAIDAALRPHP